MSGLWDAVLGQYVGADNKSVVAFGEAPRQLTAQAVGLLWGDLARNKGLPDGIGNHIIGPARLPVLARYCRLENRNSASAIRLSHW